MQPNDTLAEFLKNGRKLAVPTDANFRRGVWQRIEAEKRSEDKARRTVAQLAIAGGLCALTLTAAGWKGHATARAQVELDRETMANHYLASLDARAKVELHK